MEGISKNTLRLISPQFPPKVRYRLLVSTVVSRPIAWFVSQSASGVLNAAPFSFFNAFAGDPPVVGIGIGSHDPGRPKDTRRNIRETRQFVVNLVSEEMAEAMECHRDRDRTRHQ
jgi:flavin reductase (DIM6/NTAB) family NADH-FMN oxidoreductase RutF